MSEKNKLNSMRFLETQKVPYEVLTYDSAIHDAAEAAAAMQMPPEQVYKTLVVLRSNGKPVLMMVAATNQLDLKKFAAAIGDKKVSMAPHAEAEKLTGLKVGGIGALALVAKHWDVYLDETATKQDRICVNAGQRGLNLRVGVSDLIRALKAQMVDAGAPLNITS
ncbi:MAG TPA: YbaK/EbsC family protein [Aggregatilineales bacterium]|nr:YbaK/EbsC family protein [Aggregatilineales bacterium]